MQQEGETVDEFITDLFRLVENCKYGDLQDELVRDRIVVGLRDSELSEKLQLTSDLTLEAAVTRARQSESMKTQQKVVREEVNIDQLNSRPSRCNKRRKPSWTSKPPSPSQHCGRCGKAPPHSRDKCPAKDIVCHKCSLKGHYAKCCKTKRKVNEVTLETEATTNTTSAETVEFLDTVDAVASGTPWVIKVQLNNRDLEFKVDTGADVTVLPEGNYQPGRDGALETTTRKLSGPTGDKLKVLGKISGYIKRGGEHTIQDIYVVRGLTRPLMGKPAIEALQVVTLKVQSITSKNVRERFPKLFNGLGKLDGAYTIKLRENATPFALTTPRRVAVPLLPKVKQELERMQSLGVITEITEATEWCAGMVVVPKANGEVRICVDLTKLNENVCRERHMLPSVEQVLAQIGDAKHFSKLDANSGFWQIKLDEQSSKLTTFITPFGRFRFNRLPFGITSAPEHFQRQMSELLQGIDGVVVLIDDTLIAGKTKEEHDHRLNQVLTRLEKAGLTLGLKKCAFNQSSVKFLGQIVDRDGIRPDPDKVQAIQEMSPPRNVSELRRFLGMINQQSKFSPSLAENTKPLRDLLSKKNHWRWTSVHQETFDHLKESLSTNVTLGLYDPDKESVLSADASSYGLGAVLRQKQPDGTLKPIAYASRSMTDTEQRYAQIEKEALALTWACERFQHYLVGAKFRVETDHKPLVPLLSTKTLDQIPIRVQCFRLRLMRFDFTINHVPGKELHTADTLSRAPLTEMDDPLRKEVNAYVEMVVTGLPASEQRLENIREQQDKDPECSKLKELCEKGNLTWDTMQGTLKPYYPVRDELNIVNGILMRGQRMIIPTPLRKLMLSKLHSVHQGVTKCKERANQSVWWPGIGKQIKEVVYPCLTCCKYRKQRPEPLIPSQFPKYPWQVVATDLFERKGTIYLLLITTLGT